MPDLTLPLVYGQWMSVILIATFALSLALLAALSFADSRNGQQLARAWLARRLAHTRMFAMLAQRGILPQQYIANTPIPAIRAQLKTCRQCTEKQRCDRALNYFGHRRRNLGFCPNRAQIDQLLAHPPRQ